MLDELASETGFATELLGAPARHHDSIPLPAGEAATDSQPQNRVLQEIMKLLG